MGLDPIVDMAVKMKCQSVKEQASIRVAKMALELTEQSGREILEMVEGSAPAAASSPGSPFPGNVIDISV